MALTSALLDGVVFNEVGANPTGSLQDLNGDGVADRKDEFIELHNTSGAAVDIAGWRLFQTSGIVHTFAAPTVIPAGGFLTLVDAEGGTSNAIQNVQSDAIYVSFSRNFGTNYLVALVDATGTNYISMGGPNGNPDFLATQLNSAFPGITRIGQHEFSTSATAGNATLREIDGDTAWIMGPPTIGSPNCFAAGTGILTPSGMRAIDDLRPGDTVCAKGGRQIAVKWIWVQSIPPNNALGERFAMIRIQAGALGKGLPGRDLVLTSDHALMIDGLLINAGALVNGTTIAHVPAVEKQGKCKVYHIETEGHDLVFAEGCLTETFVDYAGRQAFDNYSEYAAIYGEGSLIAEMTLPRVSAARLVPLALRASLKRQDSDRPRGGVAEKQLATL